MRRISNEKEFARLWEISDALVVDFSATWCGPCRMLEPTLKKLEKENPEVDFVKVDIDEHMELSDKHRVEAVPTVLFVRRGRVVKRIVGVERYQSLSRQAKKLLVESTRKRSIRRD